MIFKRYSSPFIFLDNLILEGKLSEGIDTIYSQVEEEKLWQLYLSNPLKEKSYIDWKNEIMLHNAPKEEKVSNFEVAKEGARNILKTFKPY